MSRTPNSRHAGQSIIRSTTGIVATAAIVGTGSLAFFVSHAYAGKTATSTTTPAVQSPGAVSPTQGGVGDDGYSYQQQPQDGYGSPYQDPYAQQGGQGGYAPQPSYGGSPQATTGGS